MGDPSFPSWLQEFLKDVFSIKSGSIQHLHPTCSASLNAISNSMSQSRIFMKRHLGQHLLELLTLQLSDWGSHFPKETLKTPVIERHEDYKIPRQRKRPRCRCLSSEVTCDWFSHYKELTRLHTSLCLMLKTSSGVDVGGLPMPLRRKTARTKNPGLPSRKQDCISPSPCSPPYPGYVVFMAVGKLSQSSSHTHARDSGSDTFQLLQHVSVYYTVTNFLTV